LSETSEDDSDENDDDDEPSWVWGPEHAVPGDVECHAFDDERALLRGFVATVLALDPDVLIGFEVQGESLGFLADRARRLDVDLLRHVSRSESVPGANERQDDEYGRLHASGIYVTGRIVLNLWRVLRGELKLQSYAFESCVSAVLGRRVPKFSAKTLSRWAVGGDDDSSREKKKKRETNVREGGEDANHDDSNKKKKKPPSSHQRWRAIHHVCARALLVSKMCEQLDVVARTNEQAKIFGIDFQSVVFRGSQYRVESMMLRLAHLENYLAPSPSAEQTSRQPAMECLPLVMEPESKLYVDPVAVLDFASLYPSVVCAYNLCYSTCLGKVPDQRDLDAMFDETGDEKEKASLTGLRADQVAGLGGGPPRKLGCHELALPPGLLPAMLRASDKNGARRPSDADGEPEPAPRSENPPGVTVTPNGVMFAPKNVRPGILPRLLAEILDTRAMVKSCLKHAPADAKARRRALNAKQFGLKLIANVTYGYTAAGFSGRMPMAELADAIVQCGRDTLERAIRTVHSGDARWRGARVVYGDTDSLFVHFPGYSKASAFDAAAAIAAAVTADNPDPVTLKLEKVYHPCILATKKRYVGHAYESPTQRAPLFDAKGIEVARRDNCPLLVKTQRVALQLLFHNKDLSLVKRYVQRHVAKLRAGRIPLGDLVFAKETRLGTYSKTPGAQKPPAAIVAESLMARDPRAEPKFGERVPYVVVCGEPGGRLMDMIAHPRAVAEARGTLRINAKYYGDKVIAPAMQRLLGLVGADVSAWLREPAALASANDFAKRAFAAPLASTFGSSSPFENARKHQSARRNIDQFFLSVRCAVCGELTEAPRIVCVACASSPGAAAATLAWRAAALERDAAKLARVCLGCGGGGGAVTPAGFAFRGCGEFISGGDPGKGHAREVSLSVGAVECVSLDCALFYRRRKTETELRAAAAHVDAAFQRGGGLDETR
jgi:DNA polymerase zeta